MSQPTGTLPVKLMSLMRSSVTRSPASSLESGRTLSPPSGHPACCTHSARSSEQSGVCGRGLQHHGATGRDGRSDFVGDEVDGEIKGRDAGDGAERKTAHDAPASGSGFLPIERKIFAVNARALFGGDVEGEDGAFDFGARGFDGLAGLLRESAGKFFFALEYGGGNSTEHALAFESGQAASGAEGLDGSGDGGLGVLAAALGYAGDEAAVVGSVNLDNVAVVPPPAIHKETVRRNGCDRHLCHDFSLAPGKTACSIIGLLDDRDAARV